MAKEIKRDGKVGVFKDDATEEEINAYFERLKAPTDIPEKPDEPEGDGKRGILTDVPVQIMGGVRDGVQSTIGLWEKVGEDLSEKTNIGGWVFGKDAKDGWVDYVSAKEAKERGTKFIGSGKIGEKDAFQLPEVDEADTITGGLSRGVSQFLSGWFTGGRLIKGAGLTTSLAKGAIADIQVFDSDTGRFADMVNTFAPSLQNPLLDYLASDEDETFYEARLKNAIEGLFLGGMTEGVIRSTPHVKDQLINTIKYLKLNRAKLSGKKVDVNKLKEVEENLIRSTELEITPVGKQSAKKFAERLKKEADTKKTAGIVEELKEITSAKELNEKILNSFDNFMEAIGRGVKTVRSKEGKLNWRNIDDYLNFNLSPRAYADTNFGIIFLEAMQRMVRSDRKFDKITDSLVEKLALKSSGDILHTTKMMGQLGDKLEGGLKYMWGSQATQQNLADTLYKMANSLRKGEKTYTENEMKITTAMLMKIMRFDDKVTSNLGRGLRLRGVLKDAHMDLSSEAILNQVRNFEKWDGNFKEFIEGVALVKDKNMLIRISDYLFRNNFWNKANEVWMSAALSLPKTQVINVLSTGLNQYIKPIESIIGSKLTWGLDPKTAKGVRKQAEEAMQTLAGLRSYVGDALMFAKRAFNKEDSILFAGSTKFDLGTTKALGTGWKSRLTRIPLRALTAADEFFKQINYRSKLTTIAVREANAHKGLSKTKVVGKLPNGKKITEFEAYVADRFKQGFDETGLQGVDAEATRYAKEVTFTKELDGVLGKFQQAVNDAPVLKLAVPFIKTPANLAIQAVEKTPLGIFGKNWKHFKGHSGDVVRIAETRGRVVLGSTILFTSALLANSGIITGGGHPDKSIRRNQKNAGYEPYSIKIGNVQIQYGRLDPIGMLIGTIADFNEIYADLNEKDRMEVEGNLMSFMINQMEGKGQETLPTHSKVGNMVVAGYKSVFENIASKTYLRSLIDILTALNGDDIDKRGAWWLRQKFASFYPNIFSKVTNDPYLRETRNLVDELRRKIGLGLHKDVQLAYNFIGEPIENKQNVVARYFNAAVNPLTIKVRENDFVLEKIIEHEINIPPLNPVKNGVDLREFVDDKGKSAFDYYNEEIAKSSLRKELEMLFKSKRFNDAPDQIILDKNNKFGGKKAMTYQKVKSKRDLIFLKIQYSSKFKSKQNSEITLGKAYVNKNIITTIGKATNKYPKNMKTGIYDFIQSSP
jgi:hypothetical protein